MGGLLADVVAEQEDATRSQHAVELSDCLRDHVAGQVDDRPPGDDAGQPAIGEVKVSHRPDPEDRRSSVAERVGGHGAEVRILGSPLSGRRRYAAPVASVRDGTGGGRRLPFSGCGNATDRMIAKLGQARITLHAIDTPG